MKKMIALLRAAFLMPFNILMGMSTAAVQSQGTTLHIAGTAGGAKTISGVAVGSPTILTATAHGFSNGDVVALAALTGTDAAELNALSFVVTNKTTNTFAVLKDTTGKTITAGSGTATPSAWVKIGQLTDIKGTSDTSPDIEVTDLDSTAKEYMPGLPDTGSVSMSVYCVDSDAGLSAMEASFDAREVKTFKVTYPSGATPVRTFSGYVKSFPKVGDASKDGVVTGSVEIKRSGSVTKS